MMASEDVNVLGAYLKQKQDQWIVAMRHDDPDPAQSDQERVRAYVRQRTVKTLAKEFVADDAFLAHHICGILTHAHDRDLIQEMTAVGAYVLNVEVVGDAAPTVLAALRWTCKTRAGRKWVPALTLGATAFFGGLLYLVTRKHLGAPPR